MSPPLRVDPSILAAAVGVAALVYVVAFRSRSRGYSNGYVDGVARKRRLAAVPRLSG